MKTLVRRRQETELVEGFDLGRAAVGMLENVAINVMFADTDFVIRYINPASVRTLRSIERLLPVPVDRIIGSSIDVFHRNPMHQRGLLTARSTTFPHDARFPLGSEWLDLTVGCVLDAAGATVGYLVNWSVVTDQVVIEREVTEATANVARAIDEMRSSIGDIAASAVASVGVTGEAAESADSMLGLVAQLAARAVEIEEVVAFIATVAEQTNLLALNATIEAARAGEVGRGFAVVAGEVKELANETDRATDRIRASVRALQADAETARLAAETMGRLISSVSDNSSSIAAAVEQQTAVAESIVGAAQRAAEVVRG